MSDLGAATSAQTQTDAVKQLLLQREIENFLYLESELVDARRFEAWLELFSDDVRYWIPIRKNLAFRDHERDVGGEHDIAWFDDDKATLRRRVAQIMTGIHWAEEPLSRVVHLVTNVRLERPFDDAPGEEAIVNSNVLVHRSRLDTEEDILVGRRQDRLRRAGGSFQITWRKVILNHATLAAKNLTFFI